MSLVTKQLIVNKIFLPKEIIDMIKDYLYHKIKTIPKNDLRYNLLLRIPFKDYDPDDETSYVYMRITDEKDYYLVYTEYTIQVQTLGYCDDGRVYFIDGSILSIK